MSKPLLDVEGLTTRVVTARGTLTAVDDASLRVDESEIVGIVGESGAGKSLLARSITGLLPQSEKFSVHGSVRYRGREILGLKGREAARLRGNSIGMVFQDPATYLNPVMSIGDQIAENLHGVSRRPDRVERVRELLRMVGLPASRRIEDNYAHELSGGMGQRALIAMALAGEPGLLVADEPTTALDATIQVQILDLLAELRDSLGMGVAIISHDLGVVARLCDRVYVMYAGKVVESSSVKELFGEPRHPYTRGLIQASDSLRTSGGRFSSIPGRVPPLHQLPSGCSFNTRCTSVTDVCHQVSPELLEVSPEHNAACHNPQSGTIELASVATMAPQAVPVGADAQFPAVSEEPLVELRGVTKRFSLPKASLRAPRETLIAVNDVSLRIETGETLALVGESGSGKSTIGRLVLGQLEPSAGTVLFDGKGITNFDRRERIIFRRNAQMVYQDPYASLNPTKKVEHILCQPFMTHNICSRSEARQRAVELLEAVGLSSLHLQRFPHQLSGGEQQRVAFARALSLDPKLVVADEPVSALDVSVRAQVLELMQRFRSERDLSYLLITHDLSNAAALADSLAVLYLGRVVEYGPVKDIMGSPKHPYTKALLDANLPPNPELARAGSVRLQGEIPSASQLPPGCAFHTRCPYQDGDRCQHEIPVLRPVGSERRRVSCHYADLLNLDG